MQEVRYMVKYHLLMLNSLKKALIGIEDNLTHDKILKCLEKSIAGKKKNTR